MSVHPVGVQASDWNSLQLYLSPSSFVFLGWPNLVEVQNRLKYLLLRVVAATSVAADPSDTTLRCRTTFSGTIWVDGD